MKIAAIDQDVLARNKSRDVAQATFGDSRQQAVIDLAGRCRYPEIHSQKVASLALQIFHHTLCLHRLAASDAQLLEYAGLLHDIGHHIGHNKHHKHGYRLIMSADLPGFAAEERTIVANVVRYHRKAEPRQSHPVFAALPSGIRLRIRHLTAILRIADGLDHSRLSLFDEIRCRGVSHNKIQFQLLTVASGMDFGLDLDSAKRRACYFEGIFDVETCFTVKRMRLAA